MPVQSAPFAAQSLSACWSQGCVPLTYLRALLSEVTPTDTTNG